jgi:hypothetical protein
MGQYPTSQQGALLEVVKRLQTTLTELPVELRLSSRCPSPNLSAPPRIEMVAVAAQQFAIMRVNIYVTSLYLQSSLLDIYLNSISKMQRPSSRGYSASIADSASSCTPGSEDLGESTAQAELWELREELARELLDIVTVSSPQTLEANGLSMVSQINSSVP